MVSLQPAPYWARLGARLVDVLIIVIAWFLTRPLLDRILKWLFSGLLHGFFRPGSMNGTVIALMRIVMILISFLFMMTLYAVVNGFYLKRSGQTIGKKLFGIQILDQDGNVPALYSSLVKRDLTFFAVIPLTFFIQFLFIGGSLDNGIIFLRIFFIADVLFIFSNDRRCLHDHYARTQVCKLLTDSAL